MARAAERLRGPRRRCVEQMPARRTETERLQELLRDLRRVDLPEPDAGHALRAESSQQLLQTGATVFDEPAERHNLRRPLRDLHVKDVGLDALVGRDGESCDVVL